MHDWGPLVGDLKSAQGPRARDGRSRSRRAATLARQAHGARTTRPVARSRARGSSTGCSPTTWTRASATATSRPTARSPVSARSTAAPVAIAAYDFTVMAGSMGAVGEDKIARMRAHALRQRIPMVWLLDSAGARIQSTSGSTFAGAGALFREQVAMSGVVPMVAAMLGHCAAGHRLHPGAGRLRADGEGHVVDGARRPPPREGRGRRGRHRGGDGRLGRPHEDLGRRRPRSRRRRRVPRRSCASTCRSSRSTTASARRVRPTDDPVDRRVEELYDIVPTAPRRAYDMRKVVTAIVDDGDVFWMKPEWAKNLVTGFARIGGQAGRHRREPADGARRRARRERGRQGGALRVAVRRVQHPARVPARRAGIHRRQRGREAGHHPPRRQDAVRGVARRRCRRSA